MKKMVKIVGIKKDVFTKLQERGIIMQVYDARSSSVYLKLDCGVLNSVRIADHDGKKHLQYRYNLIVGGEDNIVEEKYIRYFFNENSVDRMIEQILFDRRYKMQKYGEKNYRRFIEKNFNDRVNDKGFWKDCTFINTLFFTSADDQPINFNCNKGIFETLKGGMPIW